MAITRKPKSNPNVDVDTLINKGGSVVKVETPKPKVMPVALRIPTDILERLEHVLASRPVRLPRHTWILEAIVEKLDRESI